MNVTPKIWMHRGFFLSLGLLAVAFPLLPLQFTPARLAAPDLLFALVIAWIIRQPQSAPFVMVASLALLADAVLMRPLGLWALLLLATSEIVRFSYKAIQERSFIIEYALATGLFLLMALLQNFILWATFSQSLDLARVVQFVILTLLCYPAIVLLLHYILRVQKPDHSNRPDRLGKIK